MGTRARAPWLLSIGLCLAGCGHVAQQTSPEAALRELSAALERGDVKAAYALMSDPYRASHSLSDFQKQVEQNKAEARALTQSLKRPSKVRKQAQVELSDGSQLRMEAYAGRYLFETSPLDFYPQTTPRQALQSFVRAVERGRWDVVLELMPNADREGLTAEALGANLSQQQEELERMVALLKASLDSPIEEVSDRATMPYGESFTARFVREDERWKIEDPE